MKSGILKKIRIYFLLLTGAVFIWGCNATSEKQTDRAGMFNETADISIERLQRTMTEEMIDSVVIQEYLEREDLPEELHQTYLRFYKNRAYLPAWVDEYGPSQDAKDFLKVVEDSNEHGFSPEDYKLQYLYHLKKSLDRNDVGLKDFQQFEKEFTAVYLHMANDILRGRIDPQQFDAKWVTTRRKRDLALHLKKALEKGDIKGSLKELEPGYEGYQGLKEALNFYSSIEAENPYWPALPEKLVLKPGDSSEYVSHLAGMLHILGDLEKKPQEGSQLYDAEIAGALADFQERNGLVVDSIVANKTLAMLNVPLSKRVGQIKLNMERLRWLPERPEGRHVVVNIPEYKLFVYEGSDSVLNMRVIVGEAYESTTPIFIDTIEYVTFSPTWTVPQSIATEEMLPALCNDPDYLSKRNFRLYESWNQNARELDPREIDWKEVKAEAFPYRIVQDPGGSNSLGRVKFMFPNKMSIYLHDTPADYLFERNERAFSHGCIRVEKPAELSRYLLQEEGFGYARIQDYMNRPEPDNVPLSQKVPILIDYRTAWMSPEGKVHFREDVYGHDNTQLKALKAAIAKTARK